MEAMNFYKPEFEESEIDSCENNISSKFCDKIFLFWCKYVKHRNTHHTHTHTHTLTTLHSPHNMSPYTYISAMCSVQYNFVLLNTEYSKMLMFIDKEIFP